MIREPSELDAIASEIHISGQPIALDLETYGTSEDNKIRKEETIDPWRGGIRLLSLQLPDLVPWLIDLSATVYCLGGLIGSAIGNFVKSVWKALPDASLEVISIGDTGGAWSPFSGCCTAPTGS